MPARSCQPASNLAPGAAAEDRERLGLCGDRERYSLMHVRISRDALVGKNRQLADAGTYMGQWGALHSEHALYCVVEKGPQVPKTSATSGLAPV